MAHRSLVDLLIIVTRVKEKNPRIFMMKLRLLTSDCIQLMRNLLSTVPLKFYYIETRWYSAQGRELILYTSIRFSTKYVEQYF